MAKYVAGSHVFYSLGCKRLTKFIDMVWNVACAFEILSPVYYKAFSYADINYDSKSSFFLFWHMQLYMSWHIISFSRFIFTF